jgi:hypothetical protein
VVNGRQNGGNGNEKKGDIIEDKWRMDWANEECLGDVAIQR